VKRAQCVMVGVKDYKCIREQQCNVKIKVKCQKVQSIARHSVLNCHISLANFQPSFFSFSYKSVINGIVFIDSVSTVSSTSGSTKLSNVSSLFSALITLQP
jgi:hypothetical protein